MLKFSSPRRQYTQKLLVLSTIIYLIVCLCWIFVRSIAPSLKIHLPFSSYNTIQLTVRVRNGLVEGTYKKSYTGRQFLAFEGIPYAAPPVGKFRFKSPKRVLNWTGTLFANKTYICIQMKNKEEIIGDENCLYLNVYVPKIPMYGKLPVMVNFHSGNFMNGNSGQLSGPTKIMDRNVVYVTVNYRLGVLGFFSTFDEVIPGNFGLKDQSYALKWIKKNIEHFGGDNQLVTIIGMSAGGSSVHYHYFSPLSKGLFHRGISQSGTAIDPWALKSNEIRTTRKIYRKVGCVRKKLRACMEKANAEKLVKTTAKIITNYDHLPISPLGPVVEAYHKDAFITIDPYDLLMSKEFYDVPYLITTTTEEGFFQSIYYLNHLKDLNEKWNKIAPLLFEYYSLYNRKEIASVSKNITKTFFKNQNITMENFKTFVKVLSDRLWNLGAEKSARLHAINGKSNVYLMKVGYKGESSNWAVAKQKFNLGVGHLEDSKFYYDHNSSENNSSKELSETESQMKDILLDIVTTFAKYGRTNVENWNPVNRKGGTLEYLHVRGPNELFINNAENRTTADNFWSNVRKMLEKHSYG